MSDLAIPLDLAKDGLKILCSRFVSIAKWKAVFRDIGDAIINSPRYRESACLGNLKAVLSKDNLSTAARESRKQTSDQFLQYLDNYWAAAIRPDAEELTKSGVEPDQLRRDIIEVTKNKIELVSPELSELIKQNELNLAQEKANRQLTELVNGLNKLNNSANKETGRYIHVRDLDAFLQTRSRTKPIGLKFYDYQDANFIASLEKQLSQSSIFVCGRYHEETAFSVCEALRKLRPDADTYLCFDEKTWNAFKPRSGVRETYVINWFVAANPLQLIQGCHSVFVCNFQQKRPDCVLLRHRTWRSTEKALKEAGFSDAWKITKAVNNEYPPLSRLLFRDYIPIQYPAWRGHYGPRLLLALLLAGEWSAISDWDFICKLSGQDRETIEEKIRLDQQDPDPLIKEKQGHIGSPFFSIISFEEAWRVLGTSISAPMIDRFFEQAEEALLNPDETGYSTALRKAILATFSYLQIYSNISNIFAPIRTIITHLVSRMRQTDCSSEIEGLLPLAAEASPEIFFEAIKEDVTASKTSGTLIGFMSYFTEKNRSYPGILWAYDLLLTNEDTAFEAALVLADWIHLFQGKLFWEGNSPLHSLTTILLAWIKNTPIPDAQRKEIFDRAIATLDDASLNLMSLLQYHGGSTASALYEPHIRSAFYSWQGTSWQEAFDLYQHYCKRYFDSCANDTNLLVKFIEQETFYAFIPFSDFSEHICSALSVIGDQEKEKLHRALRKYVYKNRYFSDSDWAADEEYISKVESLTDTFAFDEPEYSYLYLFTCSHYDVPISHPDPFSGKLPDNSIKQSEAIEEAVNSFVSRGCDCKRMNELLAGETEVNCFYPQFLFACRQKQGMSDPLPVFGEAIRSFQNNSNASWQLIKYAKQTYPHLKKELAKACAETENPLVCSEFLSSLVFDIEDPVFTDIFGLFAESVKDAFWTNANDVPAFALGIQNIKFIANALIEHENSGLLVELVYQAIEGHAQIEPKEIVILLEKVDAAEDKRRSLSTYYFKIVMDYLRIAYGNSSDLELITRLAKLELKLDPEFSENKPYFLKRSFKYSPSLFADVIAHFSDPNYLHIYRVANFCPGEEGGRVDIGIFESWARALKEELAKKGVSEFWYNKAIAEICVWGPAGLDGIKPAPDLRAFLNAAGKETLDEFVVGIMNKHSMHVVTDGQEYYDLASRFEQQSKELKGFPHLSKAYRTIAQIYHSYGDEERRQAEDE